MCPRNTDVTAYAIYKCHYTAAEVGRARSPGVAQCPTGDRLRVARNRRRCLPSERQFDGFASPSPASRSRPAWLAISHIPDRRQQWTSYNCAPRLTATYTD
jgi:hypothetical protein